MELQRRINLPTRPRFRVVHRRLWRKFRDRQHQQRRRQRCALGTGLGSEVEKGVRADRAVAGQGIRSGSRVGQDRPGRTRARGRPARRRAERSPDLWRSCSRRRPKGISTSGRDHHQETTAMTPRRNQLRRTKGLAQTTRRRHRPPPDPLGQPLQRGRARPGRETQAPGSRRHKRHVNGRSAVRIRSPAPRSAGFTPPSAPPGPWNECH
jgi:hypothetical protein